MRHRTIFTMASRGVILAGLTAALLATPLAAVADQATGSQGAQDTTAASTTHVDGWNKTSEGLEYWQDGQRVCSRWVHDQGVWYYLSDEGLALTGRQTIDGSDYYFDVQTCGMATGWAQDPDGTWFLADGNGALQTGWKRVGGLLVLDGPHDRRHADRHQDD